MMTKILSPGYTQRGALELLLHTDATLELLDIDEVYYPYIWIRYRIQAGKGRFVKKQLRFCDCIVDRVSGSTYEAKGEPDFSEIEIDEDESLDVSVLVNECYDIAHDFVLKQYIGKEKLIFAPEMMIDDEEQFYKKFYIVTCREKQGFNYYIMVDAVDGGISILDHEKHIENLVRDGELEEAERVLDSIER